MLKQLIHSGVVIPQPEEPRGLTIMVRGKEVALTPKQEEMAMAWARKKDTDYVEDPVFVSNFLKDFSAALGERCCEPPLRLDEVDFSACYAAVDAEREAKEALSKEERKAAAAERKARREELRAKYGYAIVNGQRVELGTYMVEPSGIFMGRGQHPLRGRWKEGASKGDITLNYGPNPETMPTKEEWADVVWQPDSLWVARWKDKLTGRLKYIWFSDTSIIKQRREAAKFDEALELDRRLPSVRKHINEALEAENQQTRMIATACYLIDALNLRVGDEKDAGEADTVGATTLRPEHVQLLEDGRAEFEFLGKDWVKWHKTIRPPRVVLDNLAELICRARPSSRSYNGDNSHPSKHLPQLFPDVTSRDVNAFLSELMPGLTAKVFRTHHATKRVRESLANSPVVASDPEYKKWEAASLANYEAALVCNHTKQARGNWERTSQRYEERIARARERLERYREQVRERRSKLKALCAEADRAKAEAEDDDERQKLSEKYAQRIAKAEEQLKKAEARRQRAETRLGKTKAKYTIAGKKRQWNLNTSLRAYVDPRVYYEWGKKVDYDVLTSYYPAKVRRRFSWVRTLGYEGFQELDEAKVNIRTCMVSDLKNVADLFAAACEELDGPRLPLDPQEIGELYLPALYKPWKEAFVALRESGEAVAFVVLGPRWGEEEDPNLDLFAVVHPAWEDSGLTALLADELERRFQAYLLQHPIKRSEEPVSLEPSTTGWFEYATELVAALEIEEQELAVSPEQTTDDDADRKEAA